MDREQTPLKQRQKRGAARHANANASAASVAAGGGGGSERAFRSSSSSQRGRAKVSGPDKSPSPGAILAKPPLTILRAPPLASSSGGGGGVLYDPASPMAATTTAKTLYSPPPPPPTPQRNSMLRVKTTLPSGVPFGPSSPSPSPLAVAGTPQSLRKPSTPGGGSGVAPPAAVLQRPNVATQVPPLVTVPPTSTKLITPTFQFASDIPTRLASCLELTNFTVVGTLGLEGAGKSTLLSLLARLAFASAVSSEQAFDTMAALRDRSKNPHFLAQRLETQLAGLQETQGVDLAVACEAPRVRATTGGLVLLDTQPLLSASHLAELLARTDASPAGAAAAARYGALSPEQQSELASVQIAVLLLSVCHYVVVPVRGDSAIDLEMVALLRKVHDKMQQSRLPNVAGHVAKEKHHAQLLFVANEASSASVNSSHGKALQALTRVLPQEWIYRVPRSEAPSAAKGMAEEIPMWKFTTLDAAATPHAVDDWRAHAIQWARLVESLPASPSFTKSTAMATAPPPLTLKEWLSSTARVWESVKRSSALAEEYTTRDHY